MMPSIEKSFEFSRRNSHLHYPRLRGDLMPGLLLTADLELSHQNYDWDHDQGQPGKRPETVHERKKLTLVQELAIDHAQRG